MTLQEFNLLSKEKIKELLFQCCGCTAWADQLLQESPYASFDELRSKSDNIWFSCDETCWLEAFTHHPKIGDLKSLEEKFAITKHLALAEQSRISQTSPDILIQLRDDNIRYEEKFGFIFIVCATGKSAEEMLLLLLQRLKNDRSDELKIAVAEQNKITHIRINKLFE